MLAQACGAGAGGAECCGLLAGRDAAITRILPARNAAERPESEYEIAPEELFRLMREIRGAGLEMLGIYHSHPSGGNSPSASDIERAFYPEAAYFIVSPRAADDKILTLALGASPPVRAFAIRDGAAVELEIVAE
jgi:proteasome lid subunit RPN8/RPN11